MAEDSKPNDIFESEECAEPTSYIGIVCKLRNIKANQQCFDCNKPTTHAESTHGLFLCDDCGKKHKKLDFNVFSIDLKNITECTGARAYTMLQGGNENAEAFIAPRSALTDKKLKDVYNTPTAINYSQFLHSKSAKNLSWNIREMGELKHRKINTDLGVTGFSENGSSSGTRGKGVEKIESRSPSSPLHSLPLSEKIKIRATDHRLKFNMPNFSPSPVKKGVYDAIRDESEEKIGSPGRMGKEGVTVEETITENSNCSNFSFVFTSSPKTSSSRTTQIGVSESTPEATPARGFGKKIKRIIATSNIRRRRIPAPRILVISSDLITGIVAASQVALPPPAPPLPPPIHFVLYSSPNGLGMKKVKDSLFAMMTLTNDSKLAQFNPLEFYRQDVYRQIKTRILTLEEARIRYSLLFTDHHLHGFFLLRQAQEHLKRISPYLDSAKVLCFKLEATFPSYLSEIKDFVDEPIEKIEKDLLSMYLQFIDDWDEAKKTKHPRTKRQIELIKGFNRVLFNRKKRFGRRDSILPVLPH